MTRADGNALGLRTASVRVGRRRRRVWHIVAVGLLVAAAAWPGAAYGQTPEEAPDVEVPREHLLFTRGEGGVQVLHMVELVNVGPRIAGTVPLTVPEGAQWLEVPEELLPEDGRAVDPRPLAVGEARRYVLVYEIPWQRLPMSIRRPLLYPTEDLLLWAEADELQLRGVNVQSIGREQVGDVAFNVYFMSGLQPHGAWQIVVDSPASNPARPLAAIGQRSDPVDILRTHPLPRLLLGALVVGAIVLLVPRMIPGGRTFGPSANAVDGRTSTATAGTDASTTTNGSRGRGEIARLKEEIIRADVAYDNGELDGDVYRQRRDELKRRLLALMDEQKQTQKHTRRVGGGRS